MRVTIQGSQSNLRCAARERFGPTNVSSVCKWRNIDSSMRLFADGCIIYSKITNKNWVDNLHSAKGLEGISLCKARSQKRKKEFKKLSLHVTRTSYS